MQKKEHVSENAAGAEPRRFTRRELFGVGAGLGGAYLACAGSSPRQSTSLVASTPTPDAGMVMFHEPETRRAENGRLDTSLTAKFATNELAGRTIRSRTYEGKLTGPTLRFKPGDLVRVRYVNELSSVGVENADPGHRFDVTNLHTHGLWVSPAGNSDNVLYTLMPGKSFQHEYWIPDEHVCGTFWYHPHRHGSVAPQVQNGMSGAIIIEGGIDELPEIAAAEEKLLVLQQLNGADVTDRRARETTLFGLAGINEKVTTINALHVPTLFMQPGEVQRFRIVAATSHDLLPLSIRTIEGAGPGPPPTMHPIAWDGIPLKAVIETEEVRLAPGNRVDVLVKAREPGLYILHKEGIRQADFPELPDPETLAWIRVEGPQKSMALPSSLPARFSHPDITDSEVTDQRKILFSVERDPLRFLINGKQFDENVPDPVVEVGSVEEWRLENDSDAGHPFHIHVNPFQVVDSSDAALRAGLWMDTVYVPPRQDNGENGFVVIRSRFQRYIGRFVLHCHILPHEDNGMMLLVEIKT